MTAGGRDAVRRAPPPPVSAFLSVPAGRTAEVVDDPHNRRIKLLGATPETFDASEALIRRIRETGDAPRTKLTVYAPAGDEPAWAGRGFREEAVIRGYFPDGGDAHLHARYTDAARAQDPQGSAQDAIVELARGKEPVRGVFPVGHALRRADVDDVSTLAAFLRDVFPDYPTSLSDDHVGDLVHSGTSRFHVVVDERGALLACASAEIDRERRNAEITDCATRPEARGRGLMVVLIRSFEDALPREEGIVDLYTIARADEVGMSCAFARAGYAWTGRLTNNCRMPTGFESMNVWCRHAAATAPEAAR